MTAMLATLRRIFADPVRRCPECNRVLTRENEHSFPMDGICVDCEAAPFRSRPVVPS